MHVIGFLNINFSEVFQSNFLERITQFSILDSAVALVLSFAIGLFIWFIYKKTFAGVIYSASFNLSLIAMTMITTLIILGVTSNVVLSLGMVGALSIVRFRSAIKDPIDIMFLFWAISEGILCGAGLIPLALIGAPIIGVLLVVFAAKKDRSDPYLLIVRFTDAKTEKKIAELTEKAVKRCRVKSKTVTGGSGTELIFEVRLNNGDTSFVQKLSETEDVSFASLVSVDGNMTP